MSLYRMNSKSLKDKTSRFMTLKGRQAIILPKQSHNHTQSHFKACPRRNTPLSAYSPSLLSSRHHDTAAALTNEFNFAIYVAPVESQLPDNWWGQLLLRLRALYHKRYFSRCIETKQLPATRLYTALNWRL